MALPKKTIHGLPDFGQSTLGIDSTNGKDYLPRVDTPLHEAHAAYRKLVFICSLMNRRKTVRFIPAPVWFSYLQVTKNWRENFFLKANQPM